MSANETMIYLAERVRNILDGDPRITEKNMFGGMTFLLNGHILVGTKMDGRILLSVGKEFHEQAIARPGAVAMEHNGRTMSGFVWVDADAIEDDDDLRDWVRWAERAVAQRPPKDAKPKPAAKKAPATAAVKKAPATKPVAKKPATKKAATRSR
ncbi:MAG: TfoX/Sxy family protein [Devosia sp.]